MISVIIVFVFIGTVMSVWIGGFALVDRWVGSQKNEDGIYYRDLHKRALSAINERNKSLSATDENTLEKWHDTYDAAVLEGRDEAEAVSIADKVGAPRSELDNLYSMYRQIGRGMMTTNERYTPLPGEPEDTGKLKNKKGIVTFMWNRHSFRMTSHEWVRRGSPNARMVIEQALEDGRIDAIPVNVFQSNEPIKYIPVGTGNPLIRQNEFGI